MTTTKHLTHKKAEGKVVGLRSQFKYSTSDFTGITKPSCTKKASLFKKHSDFEIPVKSSVSYLNYYLNGMVEQFNQNVAIG